MRPVVMAGLAAMVAACASAPRGQRAPSALTSVDTAYYVVPGNTRAQWALMLPRAARAAGIQSGAPSTTVGHVMESLGNTRTTSLGCQVDHYDVQLRLGHVMPRLAENATPSAEDRAAWDAFVARLWERAHAREKVGAALADSLRAELRKGRRQDCGQLIELTQTHLDQFPVRYSAAVEAAEAGEDPVEVP